jgi:hypothetical protein
MRTIPIYQYKLLYFSLGLYENHSYIQSMPEPILVLSSYIPAGYNFLYRQASLLARRWHREKQFFEIDRNRRAYASRLGRERSQYEEEYQWQKDAQSIA